MRFHPLLSLCLTLILVGCMAQSPTTSLPDTQSRSESSGTQLRSEVKPQEFSSLHPSFRFSAEIPRAWNVEFIRDLTAINVFDPSLPGNSPLDQSQIFIRLFTADRFLTLQTVEILQREETAVHGHAAVSYEIRKKDGIPDFARQPLWRSRRHRLIDVRLTNASPSLFYVFAYRPELPRETFEQFIASLRFHNDPTSHHSPLSRITERVTKKPFGIRVSPDDSPVQPERFTGFHSGTDFETFADEVERDITVSTLCGGVLRLKQRANGYGGVVVQECLLYDQPITVVYGHLALQSIRTAIGQYLAPGQALGALGKGESAETDFERKHLHLGIHRGNAVVLAGYARNTADLSRWIDPMTLISAR